MAKSERPFLNRLTVLLSNYADSSILENCWDYISWLERYGVAQNSQTPDDTLEVLAKDYNRVVRATAKASLKERQSNTLN